MTSATRRGTSNSNDRGSASSRRRRREWLLATFGDGVTAPCMMEDHHPECPGRVDATTLFVDRYPVAGVDGGRYVRGNIRPAFGKCNSRDGAAIGRARHTLTRTSEGSHVRPTDKDKTASQRAAILKARGKGRISGEITDDDRKAEANRREALDPPTVPKFKAQRDMLQADNGSDTR